MRKNNKKNLGKQIVLGLTIAGLCYMPTASATPDTIFNGSATVTGATYNGSNVPAIQVNPNAGTITLNTCTVTTTGADSRGLIVYYGNTINLNNSTIKTGTDSPAGAGDQTGVQITGGSTLNINGGTFDTSKPTGNTQHEAINVQGNVLTGVISNVNITGTVDMKTGGDSGIEAYNHAIVNINNGADLTITNTNADQAHGAIFAGENCTINFNDGSKTNIKLDGTTRNYGLYAQGETTGAAILNLNAGSKLNITTAGNAVDKNQNHVMGIALNGNNSTTELNAVGSTINITMGVNGAGGGGGLGLFASGAFAQATVDNIKIDITCPSSAKQSFGIFGEKGAVLNISGTDSSINMHGDYGQGVYLNNATANITDLDVTTAGHVGWGKGYQITGSTLNIGGTSVIDTHDNLATTTGYAWEGIRADNSNLTFLEGSETTLYTGGDCGIEVYNSTTSIKGKLNIKMDGMNEPRTFGIYVQGGTVSDTGSDTIIKFQGGQVGGIYAYNAAKLDFSSDNNLDISTTTATGNQQSFGIFLTNAQLTSAGNVKINLQGVSNPSTILTSGISATNGSKITLANSDVTMEGSKIHGISIQGANTTADLTNTNIKVTAAANISGQGLLVDTGAVTTLRGTGTIDTINSTGNSHEAILVGAFGNPNGYGTLNTAAGSDITLKSGDDSGLEVWEKSTANLGGKLTVEKTASGSSVGVNGIATKGSTLNMLSGAETVINLPNGAQGLYVEGTAALPTVTTIDPNAKLTINGVGAGASNGIVVKGDVGATTLNAYGETNVNLPNGGRGVDVYGANATGTFKNLNMNIYGGSYYGLYGHNFATINLTNSNINMTNSPGNIYDDIGIYMNGGTLNVTDDGGSGAVVTVEDGDAMRLGYDSPTDYATLNLNSGKLVLNVNTNDATAGATWHNGIENFGTINQAPGATLEINHNRTAGTVGPAYPKEGGLVAIGTSKSYLNGTTNITMDGPDSAGIVFDFQPSSVDSVVEVGATGNLNVSGSGSNVVGVEIARGKFTTDAGSTTNINLTGSDAVGIAGYDALASTVAGNLYVKAPTALKVFDGTLDINPSGGSEVQLTGDLIGDTTATGGVLNVKMDNATSFLTGKTDKGLEDINLDMSNGAIWNVTADSNLSTITNNSNATINMQHSGNDIYETVTTEDYLGTGGAIRLNTDLNSQTDSDKLVINNATTAASGEIQVYDKSLITSAPVTGEKHLLVVVDPSGKTTWTGKALDTGGLWDVTPTVERGDAFGMGDTNWYLRKYAITVNSKTQDTMGIFDSAYGTWRNVLTDDTLRKRLGDLRHTKEDEGVWARVKAGKLHNDAYDSSYQMYQVGYDKKISEDSHGGIAVDHVRTSSSYHTGSGEGSMTDVSLYGTSYHKSGAYSDVVLRAGKIGNSMKSSGTTQDALDYNTWAYSASYEIGKTYTKTNGWFFEPEAQITYGYMRGGDYTSDNGAQIRTEGTRSLVGRLGVVLGRKVKDSDYYLKANAYREFTGERSLDISTINNYGYAETGTFAQGHKDNWFEVGLGGNVKLADKTYAYGDVLKSFGGDIQKKWQVNAGVCWAF